MSSRKAIIPLIIILFFTTSCSRIYQGLVDLGKRFTTISAPKADKAEGEEGAAESEVEPADAAAASLLDAEGKVRICLVSATQACATDVGTIAVSDEADGLLITPALAALPPGVHGFTLNEKPDCSPVAKENTGIPGLASGGHLDTGNKGKHLGPIGHGHIGDLPVLVVDAKGRAQKPVKAPHLKVADLKGHAFVIYANPDNYGDEPAKDGGLGAIIACGVVK